MPFKVKDLMIDVTTVAQAPVQICPQFTFCHFGCSFQISICHFNPTLCAFYPSFCHFGCSFHISCPHGSVFTCGPTFIAPGTPVFQNPVELKEQLKAQLAAVEEAQKAADAQLQPQTVADVEMLEKKLGEALEELKARKAELQKKK